LSRSDSDRIVQQCLPFGETQREIRELRLTSAVPHWYRFAAALERERPDQQGPENQTK
jgi:hypothetical protein